MLRPMMICCMTCRHALEARDDGAFACRCGRAGLQHQDGLYLTAGLLPEVEPERVVRDRQASTYLQHAKFPTQIASFRDWLQRVVAGPVAGHAARGSRPLALDLGCGPGPYTQLLLEAGFDVVAIDLSAASLAINAAACHAKAGADHACFVQYDLNQLALLPASVDLVLMADFMQHLGSRQQRERLLLEVAAALKPGAPFYLSFFNLNLWHYLKGDVHGGFADGAIRYERLTLRNMLAALPDALQVDRTQPLNVFHATTPDRFAALFPGMFRVARMAAISGRKAVSGKLP